jgi:hypothetical protein
MHDQHRGHRPSGCPAVAVAAVKHARPGDELAQAVLAGVAVAEEDGAGAEQAVVVQCLDHWDPSIFAGVVGSR